MAKTLILVVDIDDDVGRKAKVKAPVIGEKAVVDAATKLALADPEDADANAAFKAVKIYRDFKRKGEEVEVALLTGHKEMGLAATQRIANQLDIVIKKTGADSAVLVTDGVADEVVLPLIESRVRLSGVDIVYVKQAKELEKTYFLLMEKLKDPAYARTIFGIPAIFIILLMLMNLFSIPWQFFGFLIGSYLLVKGFGFEDRVYSFISSIELHESIRLLVLVVVLFFLLTALGVAYLSYQEALAKGTSVVVAYIISADVLVNFIALFIILVFVLRFFYNYLNNNIFRLLTSLASFISISAVLVIVKVVFRWVINADPPFFTFGDVVKISFITIFVTYILYKYIDSFKKNLLLSKDLTGFEVYNIYGDYIGVVSKSDETITMKNRSGKKEELELSRIYDVSPGRIVVR